MINMETHRFELEKAALTRNKVNPRADETHVRRRQGSPFEVGGTSQAAAC